MIDALYSNLGYIWGISVAVILLGIAGSLTRRYSRDIERGLTVFFLGGSCYLVLLMISTLAILFYKFAIN